MKPDPLWGPALAEDRLGTEYERAGRERTTSGAHAVSHTSGTTSNGYHADQYSRAEAYAHKNPSYIGSTIDF